MVLQITKRLCFSFPLSETRHVAQAGLELRSPLIPNAGVKGEHHHASILLGEIIGCDLMLLLPQT